MKEDKTVPVAFHNGRGYDFHIFVKSLGRVEGHIGTIAKNSEQHISVDKSMYVSEKAVHDNEGKPRTKKNSWKIRFINSYGFLQTSLENLVENFPKEKFKMLGEAFEEEKFDLVLRKGVFPYEWIDDTRKLDETKFPPIEAFYLSLTWEGISADDYEHGRKVWEKMGFKTMREYHDMYCRVAVLQIADIMEYQRERLMRTHGLDIPHSFTLPGFSWRAALKFTKQKLELIFDREMYDFIQKAKRGGISTVTHRYAKANNPYMGRIRGKTPKEIMKELRQRTRNERKLSVEMVCEYFPDFSAKEIKDLRRKMKEGKIFNPQEVTTYLQYLDANNLYGWAMSKPLPVGGFE